MKSLLSSSLIFIMGLGLGYLINIFFTNKSYHDLVRENKNLNQKLTELMTVQSKQNSGSGEFAPTDENDLAVSEEEIKKNTTSSPSSEISKIPTHASEDTAALANANKGKPDPSSKSPTVSLDKRSVRMVIEDVSSLEEVQEFLKASAPSDPLALIKNRKDLNREAALRLNGLFSGQILFFKNKRSQEPKWEIEMAIAGEFKQNKFTGQGEIRIFNSQGKMISNTKTNPGSRLIALSSGPDDSIIADVYGGQGYIQIFYFPRLERWSGHYFEQQNVGEFEQIGVVHMFKR